MELDGTPVPTRPRAFILETVVIVGSILLAFALDAGWDTWRERSEEQATLANLRADFTTARESADWFLGLEGRMSVAIHGVLDSVREGRAAGKRSVSVPDTSLALALVPPTFDPDIATLSAIRSSGEIAALRDPELGLALSAWPGALQEATEEQEASRSFVIDQFDPTLRRGADIAPSMEIMEHTIMGGLTPEEASATTLLPTDLDVIGVLARRLQLLDHGLEELAGVRDEIDRIIGLIDRSLAR